MSYNAIIFEILKLVTEFSGTELLGIKILLQFENRDSTLYIKTNCPSPDTSNNLKPGLCIFSDHLLQEEIVPVILTVVPFVSSTSGNTSGDTDIFRVSEL